MIFVNGRKVNFIRILEKELLKRGVINPKIILRNLKETGLIVEIIVEKLTNGETIEG